MMCVNEILGANLTNQMSFCFYSQNKKKVSSLFSYKKKSLFFFVIFFFFKYLTPVVVNVGGKIKLTYLLIDMTSFG